MNSEGDDALEQKLIAEVQAGDQAAFGEIIQRYQRPVLDFIYRMLGDPDIAQDVAQDVFVRIWRSISRFRCRRDAAFSTWLFQIAHNLCVDVLRRRARDPLRMAVTDPILMDKPASDFTTRNVITREMGRRVADAVGSLPQDQRAVVVLAEYEGLSYKEIAAVMKCSVKAVESRLYRAKQALRHALRDIASVTL